MTASVAVAAISSSTSSRSLSWSAARYASAANVVTRGLRPEARIISGILSRTSLPTRSLSPRDNALVQFYLASLTTGCAVGSDAVDPLLLGQRVVAILETGLRTATYKL